MFLGVLEHLNILGQIEQHRKSLERSSRLTDSFTDDLKLIACTLEGDHRTKVHASSPLGPRELHTEHVLFTSGAVPSNSALTLLSR